MAVSISHPLLRNPPDIVDRRIQLSIICGQEEVMIDTDLFDILWPYVSNVWSITRPAIDSYTQSTGYATSYWQCRFKRPLDAPSAASQGKYKASRREVEPCQCTIRIRRHSAVTTILPTSTPHSHTLDDVDSFKNNDAVKASVVAELLKGYSASDVFKRFNNSAAEGAQGALYAAGGRYLERATVQSWKQLLEKDLEKGTTRKSNPDESWAAQATISVRGSQARMTDHFHAIRDKLEASGMPEEYKARVLLNMERIMTGFADRFCAMGLDELAVESVKTVEGVEGALQRHV